MQMLVAQNCQKEVQQILQHEYESTIYFISRVSRHSTLFLGTICCLLHYLYDSSEIGMR